MAQDLISALGARLEARLNVKDARTRSLEEGVREQVAANPPAPFTLLTDGTKQFGYAPTGGGNYDRPAAFTPPVQAEFGVGATFRRKGVLSDIPMTVTREGDGVVFAAFTDSEGLREMAFHPNQLDLVTTAQGAPYVPAPFVQPDVTPQFVSTATDDDSSNYAAVSPPVVHTVASTHDDGAALRQLDLVAKAQALANAPAIAPANAAADVSANTRVNTPTNTPTNTPAPFVMLADGTKQFGYAPTGGDGLPRPDAKTPPVSAEFGIGATFRRKGVLSDIPMTVTRHGDGIVFATFTDSEGTREMPFHTNQLDLVTSALA